MPKFKNQVLMTHTMVFPQHKKIINGDEFLQLSLISRIFTLKALQPPCISGILRI